MRRAWLALALLSASWLLGLSYYHDAQWVAWAATVVCAIALLTAIDLRTPSKKVLLATAVLAAPAMAVAPWPGRAAATLIVVGALLWAAPIPRRWPARLGQAGVTAGAILAAQSLAMFVYASVTARSHELPCGLAWLPYAVARLLGIDAAIDGTTLTLHSMRRAHPLGATWELLLDPATWCFLIGGFVLLCLRTHGRSRAKVLDFLRPAATLAVWTALWLPVRCGLLIAVFMHRALRTGYDAELLLMDQFWSPWVHLLLLLGPALLAMRFVRIPSTTQTDDAAAQPPKLVSTAGAVVLTAAGAALIALGILWVPSGPRKQGRILVDEHHSTWERTDRPYDTDWYGQESGYNYACIYDYCSRFYEMGRLTSIIVEGTLDRCDVLVVKVPTSPYAEGEIDAIERFVKNGGGLLLIGEHTSVFNTGLHLNQIAGRFGFRFRYDCLFDIDTPFSQLYRVPLAAHPIVQHVPPLDFAVSCSIAPGASGGRAAILGTGLRSLPADYHASNFYPQVEDLAEARYGAFVQLWTARRGPGRVAAFTDSTIFSNFSTFEQGKAELMLGMLEWLNHRDATGVVRPPLITLGILCMAGGWVFTRRRGGCCLVTLSAAILGWCVAVVGVQTLHRHANPLPRPVRPFVHAIVDRTVCSTPLSTSGFIATKANGFGIFERWILRLGWFTSRRKDLAVFDADILIFLYPDGHVTQDFRIALEHYVESGGKVLVLDSPENAKSTANSLLHSFGLSLGQTAQAQGTLSVPSGWPTTTVDSALEVRGGTPFIQLGGVPVAAAARRGQGMVTAIGFGSRFSDTRMGVTGDVVPNQQLRAGYDLQFRLLEFIRSSSAPGVAGGP
ncbi:MAG TPA: hypothetical protein PKH24_16320 [Sedimentisphaerales bacterium]|jgi:hypothetical protein|nr:hypothetical protein [Sedimentisphaerales bacterium]HNU30561.1 hypothetical protein [Sedimentisphaerales bacterium]